MLLCSNNRCIIIFINHDAIGSIIKNTNLNTTSTDYTNRCLINVSIYLSVYLLDVYYILRCHNLVLNTFLRLRTLKDNAIRTDNEIKPTLDVI